MCVPHTKAMAYVQPLLKAGIPVIDLSADFRLKDPQLYQQYYQTSHTCPQLIESAVYGLPELHRTEIQSTRLVANPGCYATGALLGLIPLFKSGLTISDVIVDAKSGVSGAGRKAELSLSFTETTESIKAYHVTSHRHQPEIYYQLLTINDNEFRFTFTPHLIPMKRGILSTIYVKLTGEDLKKDFHKLFLDHYQNEPFVKVLPQGVLPQTKAVSGTNDCQLNLWLDEKSRQLIIVTAIDNLLKGASGQAIQNLNLMQGFTETTGLTNLPPPI